jgi:flagellin-like hook-associated protein FlgL
VKVTQDKGSSLSYYNAPGDAGSSTLVKAGETVKQSGQDAILSVNGRSVQTDGLRLRMATQDIQADFTFNAGKAGSTTIAQVGYGDGSVFTQAGALTLASNADNAKNLSGFIANAGHTTTEKAENFEGGMQLQIGDGAGSSSRTVVGIKSMTSENLGRVEKTGMFEVDGKPIYTTKTFTMKDMLGSGDASLSQDPALAMEIIEKSINDVAGMRATIGAMQSNLLQTNENNLAVTIENVTKTESGIRDADMADTMSEFTKQQVLQNAAMSMLTQANVSSQSVLQLLR